MAATNQDSPLSMALVMRLILASAVAGILVGAGVAFGLSAVLLMNQP